MRNTIIALFFLALCGLSQAQQYVLKNGRRFAFNEVKVFDQKFVASVVTPTGLQDYNFTVNDVSSVTFPHSPELASAQKSFIQGNYEEAVTQLDIVLESQKNLIMLPNSLWSKAFLLLLDVCEKTSKDPADFKHIKHLQEVSKSDLETINQVMEIIKLKDVNKLTDMIKSSDNSYTQPRALLRCADVLQSEGKLDQAIKTYLQIPAFFSREAMLSLRATYSAADALYQYQRADDATKILSDYMIDNPANSYKEIIEAKIKMMKVSQKNNTQE